MQAQNSFSQRIGRINSGKQFEAPGIIGPKTIKKFERAKARGAFRKPATLRERLAELFIVPMVFLCGLGVVLLARVVWFHLNAYGILPVEVTDLGARTETFFAAAVLVLFAFFAGIRRLPRLLALLSGAAVMAYGENSFAARVPELWELAFSPEHYAAVADGATLVAPFL